MAIWTTGQITGRWGQPTGHVGLGNSHNFLPSQPSYEKTLGYCVWLYPQEQLNLILLGVQLLVLLTFVFTYCL